MCKPCMLLNESSRTSDTESTEIVNMIKLRECMNCRKMF